MDEKFKLYDEICETGIKWLFYHIDQGRNPICLIDIDPSDKEDLWFLSMASWVQALSDAEFYFKGNIFTFIRLKYFKKYKFLHYTIDGFDMFNIIVPDFESEIVQVFNKFPTILGEIYETYYER